jgi:hypothetical protein
VFDGSLRARAGGTHTRVHRLSLYNLPPSNIQLNPSNPSPPFFNHQHHRTKHARTHTHTQTVPLHVTRGPGFNFEGFSPLPPSYEPSDEVSELSVYMRERV